MIKVYDIETTTSSAQTHSVVAENIGQAERLFLAEYPTATIKRIILHSEYVITAGQPSGTANKEPETCKWKAIDALSMMNPHTGTGYPAPLHGLVTICPSCGKKVEVTK